MNVLIPVVPLPCFAGVATGDPFWAMFMSVVVVASISISKTKRYSFYPRWLESFNFFYFIIDCRWPLEG